jgi:hypothetical protein
MSSELVLSTNSTEAAIPTGMAPAPVRLLPVPWRDPHSVPPAQLKRYIEDLEIRCEQNPRSADLRTCLGMAYAMNFDVYKSMDALDLATQLEPSHFYSRLKWAELHYRLRALVVAEEEAAKALDLATNHFELSLARKLLQEIRALHRNGTQRPEWSRPLKVPVICLAAMLALTVMVYWK